MSKEKVKGPNVTGHTWDGDLQELDNPLPRWWIWGFYASFVFTVIYWLFYPAWPIGGRPMIASTSAKIKAESTN